VRRYSSFWKSVGHPIGGRRFFIGIFYIDRHALKKDGAPILSYGPAIEQAMAAALDDKDGRRILSSRPALREGSFARSANGREKSKNYLV